MYGLLLKPSSAAVTITRYRLKPLTNLCKPYNISRAATPVPKHNIVTILWMLSVPFLKPLLLRVPLSVHDVRHVFRVL